jgi:subtilisin family serine protease
MKKTGLFCFAIFLSLFALTLNPSKTAGKTDKFKKSERAIPNRFIVVLNDSKNGVSNELAQAETFEYELNAFYGGKVDKQFTRAINGYSVEMSEQEAVNLSQDPRVKYIEEDAEVFASTMQPGATWGLDRLDQRPLPLDGNYSFTPMGTGVNAYIIDSGIRLSHQDFGGRAVAAFDAVNDGQNGVDCNGHGTHVAGTVGSATFGVAKNVTLHSVRVLDCRASGAVSGLISGIDWVTRNHISPAVANISIGGNGISNALDSAIINSIASGVTYAVAAGNTGQDACSFSPSHVPNAITVGASASGDQRAPWSNYGSCVDIFAPGQSITSTSVTNDTSYGLMTGTSMSSPHVAGVAALYLEANPTASTTMVASSILGSATLGVLTNVGQGSPNSLLYSLVAGTNSTTPYTTPGATAATADVTGRLTVDSGFVRGSGILLVTILNTRTSETQTTFTNRLGYYGFNELPVGDTYIVSIRSKGFNFNPQIFFLTEDTQMDMRGTAN